MLSVFNLPRKSLALKKIVSIFSLASYVVHLFGFLIAFHVVQNDIRKEVKLRLKASVPEVELVVIFAYENDTREFQWIKKNEFRYRGGLYDILRSRTHADTTYYYCINDLQEERLFENLADEVRKHMQDNNAATSTAKNTGTVGEHFPVTSPGTNVLSATQSWTRLASATPHSHCADVLTPPPKSS